jgi:hypothetical protein
VCGVRDFVVPPIHKKSEIRLCSTNKGWLWRKGGAVKYRRSKAVVKILMVLRIP